MSFQSILTKPFSATTSADYPSTTKSPFNI